MEIIESTSQKLVIRFRRGLMAVVVAIFTILSIFVVLNLLVQGVMMLSQRYETWRVIALISWMALGLSMVGLGVTSWLNLARGATCTFDKVQEIVTIRQPRLFRMSEVTHSIYSVSHLDLLKNEETKSFAILLVLRSGERIPLATMSIYEEANLRGLIHEVRGFLHT